MSDSAESIAKEILIALINKQDAKLLTKNKEFVTGVELAKLLGEMYKELVEVVRS